MNGGRLPYGLFIPTFAGRAKSACGEGMMTLIRRQNFTPCFYPQRRERLWLRRRRGLGILRAFLRQKRIGERKEQQLPGRRED